MGITLKVGGGKTKLAADLSARYVLNLKFGDFDFGKWEGGVLAGGEFESGTGFSGYFVGTLDGGPSFGDDTPLSPQSSQSKHHGRKHSPALCTTSSPQL